MDALDITLIALVAVLATALALMLLARIRDMRRLRAHDEHAAEHTRQRLEAELAEARARIGELEHGADERELEPAGRFSTR